MNDMKKMEERFSEFRRHHQFETDAGIMSLEAFIASEILLERARCLGIVKSFEKPNAMSGGFSEANRIMQELNANDVLSKVAEKIKGDKE